MSENIKSALPHHVAIIMDGNGRWAKKHGLPRNLGHKEGAKTFEKIATYARDIGIRVLTVFAFSTENHRRPKEETDALFQLLSEYISHLDRRDNEGVSIKFIGLRAGLPPELAAKMDAVEQKTAGGAMRLNIAFNYGGRQEIAHAARLAAADCAAGKISADDIDEQLLAKYMFTHPAPDPEIILRTSGEMRLSNFLLWQSAYSEFIESEKLWPDFTPKDLDRVIEKFSQRERRFGGANKCDND